MSGAASDPVRGAGGKRPSDAMRGPPRDSWPMVSLLVAIAENGVIGRAGGLPWHLPDDLKRFKALTMGKSMLMGRRTFESIGRPLPGRASLVLTRSQDWPAPAGVLVVHSMEEAVARVRSGAELPGLDASRPVPDELVVIGGAEVFRLALPLARRLDLTRVHAEVSGDTFFPPIDRREWRETERIHHPPDAHHAHAMTFSVLERMSAPHH